jgi:hypothetical protein
MSEKTKVAQRYQWIKSEKTGNVVEVEKVDGDWTNFTDGSRVATELIQEFLLPLEGDELPIKSDLHAIGTIGGVNSNVVDTEAVEIEDELKSPIAILFDKQKKNDNIKLTVKFSIEIPKTDIYEIIETSFDKEEVKDELEKFILKQLDEDEVTDIIHNSINNLIEERYKGI